MVILDQLYKDRKSLLDLQMNINKKHLYTFSSEVTFIYKCVEMIGGDISFWCSKQQKDTDPMIKSKVCFQKLLSDYLR